MLIKPFDSSKKYYVKNNKISESFQRGFNTALDMMITDFDYLSKLDTNIDKKPLIYIVCDNPCGNGCVLCVSEPVANRTILMRNIRRHDSLSRYSITKKPILK